MIRSGGGANSDGLVAFGIDWVVVVVGRVAAGDATIVMGTASIDDNGVGVVWE